MCVVEKENWKEIFSKDQPQQQQTVDRTKE